MKNYFSSAVTQMLVFFESHPLTKNTFWMFSHSCSDIYICGVMEFVKFWKYQRQMEMSKLFLKYDFVNSMKMWTVGPFAVLFGLLSVPASVAFLLSQTTLTIQKSYRPVHRLGSLTFWLDGSMWKNSLTALQLQEEPYSLQKISFQMAERMSLNVSYLDIKVISTCMEERRMW